MIVLFMCIDDDGFLILFVFFSKYVQ